MASQAHGRSAPCASGPWGAEWLGDLRSVSASRPCSRASRACPTPTRIPSAGGASRYIRHSHPLLPPSDPIACTQCRLSFPSPSPSRCSLRTIYIPPLPNRGNRSGGGAGAGERARRSWQKSSAPGSRPVEPASRTLSPEPWQRRCLAEVDAHGLGVPDVEEAVGLRREPRPISCRESHRQERISPLESVRAGSPSSCVDAALTRKPSPLPGIPWRAVAVPRPNLPRYASSTSGGFRA